MIKAIYILTCAVLYFVTAAPDYKIGAGIYDITGPAANVGMMGYASLTQIAGGIHFRLRARAFVFEDEIGNRVAYVNLDLCFTSIVVKKLVIERLQEVLPKGMYTYDNVLITSIHTHSGPAGYSWYTIYDIMCLGYKDKNVKTISEGIVNAIVMAHNKMKPASIYFASGDLITPQTNINRSPYSYQNNPPEEIKKYPYNVDKEMSLIRFVAQDNTEIGLINWYPVHGTSMSNQNMLISGDNKGYAMYLFEMYKNGENSLPGSGPFVAAFTNANEGDVSPNTKGAFCPNGSQCDYEHSTCSGKTEDCNGIGPGGKDDFLSTKIIGDQQFQMAKTLYSSAKTLISGQIDYRHTWVDMESVMVRPQYTGLNTTVNTCKAALGDSFAAGTTDGPGDFDFHQGSNSTKDNPYWNLVAHLIANPPPEQVECHSPKPILLYTGGSIYPTDWTPNILPIQVIRIGQLFIVAVPGEFTTMSGRRLRETITNTIKNSHKGPSNPIIVIAGLSNAYSQYVATPEEYKIQRYEGASTLFGPYTLPAYIQLFDNITSAMMNKQPVEPGPLPTDFSGQTIDLLPGTPYDAGGPGKVVKQPNASYKKGSNVTVEFVSADPRNNYLIQDSFLNVELKNSNGTWRVVAVDGHWETKFIWYNPETLDPFLSHAIIIWDTVNAVPGVYRIRHSGYKKVFPDDVVFFEGITNEFSVTN